MTLFRVHIDENHKDYKEAISFLRNTIERINQAGIILNQSQENLLIETVDIFNRLPGDISHFKQSVNLQLTSLLHEKN